MAWYQIVWEREITIPKKFLKFCTIKINIGHPFLRHNFPPGTFESILFLWEFGCTLITLWPGLWSVLVPVCVFLFCGSSMLNLLVTWNCCYFGYFVFEMQMARIYFGGRFLLWLFSWIVACMFYTPHILFDLEEKESKNKPCQDETKISRPFSTRRHLEHLARKLNTGIPLILPLCKIIMEYASDEIFLPSFEFEFYSEEYFFLTVVHVKIQHLDYEMTLTDFLETLKKSHHLEKYLPWKTVIPLWILKWYTNKPFIYAATLGTQKRI
jgi:hypothetical protein